MHLIFAGTNKCGCANRVRFTLVDLTAVAPFSGDPYNTRSLKGSSINNHEAPGHVTLIDS